MKKEDSDRLAREAAIRESVRGPNTELYDKSVAAAKADYQRGQAMSRDFIRQDRFGHYQAVKRGERTGAYREPGE